MGIISIGVGTCTMGRRQLDKDGNVVKETPAKWEAGGVTKEEAVEAGKVSFAEFKRLYNQLKAEERRKNLSASTR